MTRTPEAVDTYDTGVRSGRHNAALDRIWLAQHARRERPASLRLHASTPTASLGLHQAADRELRLDYCRTHGIEVVRRASGGGALYLNETQQGFSLIARWPDAASLAHVLRLGCEGMAAGLRRVGVAASYKAPNDLEVDGRKIASVFVAQREDSLLLQGTVLLDADIKTMLEALRTPTEKLSADGLAAARDRLATVRECLGTIPSPDALKTALQAGLADAFGLAMGGMRALEPALPADAQQHESALARAIDWSAADRRWVEAVWKSATGATVLARAEFTPDGRRFEAVEFAGDMVARPDDLFRALGDGLRGLPVALTDRSIDDTLRKRPVDMPGVDDEDIKRVLRLLIDKQGLPGEFGVTRDQANAMMVFSPDETMPTKDILQRASVMLVPYCAKPAWCKWRHLDGCTECGLCEVGEAYRLANARGMRVVTITHYEHLVATLGEMKADGTAAYVGMCCSNFFVKRHRAFRDAGMPTVLMDISGANCYELKQEDQAYAGRFQAEARLDEDLLGKVMRFVPPVDGAEG